MVSLVQNLKMAKTCEKPFNKIIRVLCKKTPRKNTKYSKNETILKIGYLAKASYGPCKGSNLHEMVSLVQKIKMPKTCKKTFYKIIRVVLCKKALKKIIYSRKETILKIHHLPKALAHPKAKTSPKWPF